MWEDIDYLSFSGAGTQGAAYLGLISAFEEHTDFDKKRKKIKGFAGTSVGSLCALCLLIGLRSTELIELLAPIVSSFDNIAPVLDISLLISNYGFDSGDTIKKSIRQVLSKAGLSEDITLKHLNLFFPAEFICVTTNMTTMDHEFISCETYPYLQVVDAVFMSMCVPFLFAPAKVNNTLYVDGALTMNTPQCFDNCRTLCVLVDAEINKSISNWPAYIHRLFVARMVNQKKILEEYGYLHEIKIGMNKIDTDVIDLHINTSTVKRLILQGYICAIQYIYPNFIHTMEIVLRQLVALHVADAYAHDDEKINYEYDCHTF